MISKSTISFIQSLKLKKFRQKYNKFILEGEKIVLEGLNENNISFDSIFCLPEKAHLFDNINEKYNIINAKEMHKLSIMKSPPGILAIANIKSPLKIQDIKLEQINLYLENINDPGNLGTIIRTADWFGFSNIIVSPNTVDIFNSKVIQASMGSFARIHHYVSTIQELQLNHPGMELVATTLSGDDFFKYRPKEPIFLMIGSESHGLSEEAISMASKQISIPSASKSKAESLNAAIAASIVLSHFYGFSL